MKDIARVIKNILLVTLPTLAALFLLLEVFFRVVIPASQWPFGYYDEENRMLVFDNKRETGLYSVGRFAEIRSRWRINNRGWNYPIDYYQVVDKKLIAVIGDSFIQAFQVDVDKNYPYLLREKLYPEYEVFAFGKDGAPMSHYLHTIRYVNRYFDPDILIINVALNDFDESIYDLYPDKNLFFQVTIDHQNNVAEKMPASHFDFQEANTVRRLLYNSALIRYLYNNIQWHIITREAMTGHDFEEYVRPEQLKNNKDLIYESTRYIVQTIREENTDKRVIFVFDAPRQAIYEGFLDTSRVLWLYEMMEEICRENNVEYIDLTGTMKQGFERNQKKFNFDIDGHWNEYGHRFVADYLHDYLKTRRQGATDYEE